MALRVMAREKGFTLAALLSLALGIGANTALFSVVSGVLLKPLPYPGADRILRISEFHPGATSAVSGGLLTNFTYHAWKEGKTIEDIGGFRSQRFTETSGAEPVKIAGAALTPSAFRALGIRPALGRLFVDEDAVENAPGVAVISDGLWQEKFGEETSVLGRQLILDGKPYAIVGVAPRDFYFPDRDSRIFTPYRISQGSADPAHQSVAFFGAIARLREGATPQQAAEEGTLLARAQKRPPVVDAVFGKGGPVTVRADLWLDDITARIRPALAVFGAGALFILLIACSNVASLQLTRGVSRQRELAVRASLGASRGRLLTQLMVESLVLVALGGVCGLLVSRGLLAVLPALAPRNFPRIDDISADASGTLFAGAATLVAALLSSLLPALRASRTSPAPSLREGAGASSSARTQKVRAGLVALEAALAVVLLVGAALLFRSFGALLQVDPGYDTGQVLLARLDPGGVERDVETSRQIAERIVERVRALPGVVAAGACNMAPFDPSTAVRSFSLPSPTAPGGEVDARATAYTVTPGFAEALSLRVKQGRAFNAADVAGGIEPLMVNEEFVRLYLNDGRPVVGRRLPGLLNGRPDESMEIVGVVQNLLKNGLDQKPLSEMFSLARPGRGLPGWFHVAVRVQGDPASLAPMVRALVHEVDPLSAVETATLASRLDASVAQPRFAAWTVGAFALLALILSAAGLYGTLSYSVSQRTREIGVRSALGATRGDIVRLVFGQGLAVVTAGLAFGLTAAALGSRVMSSLLFGVTPRDPVAFLLAPLLLLLAAVLACLVPAWRGASIQPTEALRCE